MNPRGTPVRRTEGPPHLERGSPRCPTALRISSRNHPSRLAVVLAGGGSHRCCQQPGRLQPCSAGTIPGVVSPLLLPGMDHAAGDHFSPRREPRPPAVGRVAHKWDTDGQRTDSRLVGRSGHDRPRCPSDRKRHDSTWRMVDDHPRVSGLSWTDLDRLPTVLGDHLRNPPNPQGTRHRHLSGAGSRRVFLHHLQGRFDQHFGPGTRRGRDNAPDSRLGLSNPTCCGPARHNRGSTGKSASRHNLPGGRRDRCSPLGRGVATTSRMDADHAPGREQAGGSVPTPRNGIRGVGGNPNNGAQGTPFLYPGSAAEAGLDRNAHLRWDRCGRNDHGHNRLL